MKSLTPLPSLTERAYSAIADEILDGRLEPGAHLVQEQLAADLGVSRQPIQQAMALLKADGLVEEVGKRGLTVARLDLTRMEHHYAIREVLDGYAARAAATAIRAGAVDAGAFSRQVDENLVLGTAAAESGSLRDQIRHDEAFHKLIYAFSGNPVLAETAGPHWRFLRRAIADVLRYAEPAVTVWQQHRAIAEAIREGDADAAEAQARAHIRVAAQRLTAAIAGRDKAGRDSAARAGAHS